MVDTRKELLDRWRGIEEEDENDDVDTPIASNKRRRLRQLKENWCCLFSRFTLFLFNFMFLTIFKLIRYLFPHYILFKLGDY